MILLSLSRRKFWIFSEIVDENSKSLDATPIGTSYRYTRYNFDGLLVSKSSEYQTDQNHMQIFHNGSLEAVSDLDLSREILIPSQWYEEELICAVTRFMSLLQKLEVQPPFAILLSLSGVKGCQMGVNPNQSNFNGHPIDRDVLIIPERIIEQFDVEPSQILRPIFDMVWNTAGWPRSINYDDNGKWNP